VSKAIMAVVVVLLVVSVSLVAAMLSPPVKPVPVLASKKTEKNVFRCLKRVVLYTDRGVLEEFNNSLARGVVVKAGVLGGEAGDSSSPFLIVVGKTGLEENPLKLLNSLRKIISPGEKAALMIIIDGSSSAAERAIELVYKLYGYYGLTPILPLEPGNRTDKMQAPSIKREIYHSWALVFTLNPTGTIVVEEKPRDFLALLDFVANLSGLCKTVEPESINVNGFTEIGYIGWIGKYMYGSVCGEKTGRM